MRAQSLVHQLQLQLLLFRLVFVGSWKPPPGTAPHRTQCLSHPGGLQERKLRWLARQIFIESSRFSAFLQFTSSTLASRCSHWQEFSMTALTSLHIQPTNQPSSSLYSNLAPLLQSRSTPTPNHTKPTRNTKPYHVFFCYLLANHCHVQGNVGQ